MQSQVAGLRKVMHEQEVQQDQSLEKMRMIDAQLRVWLHSEEQKVASVMECLKEFLKSEKQARKGGERYFLPGGNWEEHPMVPPVLPRRESQICTRPEIVDSPSRTARAAKSHPLAKLSRLSFLSQMSRSIKMDFFFFHEFCCFVGHTLCQRRWCTEKKRSREI